MNSDGKIDVAELMPYRAAIGDPKDVIAGAKGAKAAPFAHIVSGLDVQDMLSFFLHASQIYRGSFEQISKAPVAS